ncbi:MAG: response regulator [Myxococcota bacterium]
MFGPLNDLVLALGAIADGPEDDDDARLKHRFLIYMGVLMSVGGLVWGSISLAFGLIAASAIPYGYVVLTVLNLAWLRATRDFGRARGIQVLISLLLPFLFQYSLGGFVSSGAVMLWAMLALCGSLTFSEPRQSVLWLVLYGVFTVLSGVLDPVTRAQFAIEASDDIRVAFFVLNFTVISGIVFGLMIYLTARQKAATAALQGANETIMALNGQLEDEVAQRTRELRAALAERQAILDNLVDGLVAIDVSGDVTLMNPALQQQFELGSAEPSEGAGEYYGALLDVLESALDTEGVVAREIQMPKERTGSVKASAVRTDGGESQGVVALVRDVTLEKEVDRMKTDFIATVSHEMRTPLTSVMGFAKITSRKLEERIFEHVPEDDKRAQRAAEQIRKNMGIIVSEGERLTTLINDVLDISKMEAGRMDWHMVSLDVAALVDRAANAARSLFPPDGPELRVEVEPGLPPLVGDHDRLLQVMLNLLSNAAKFTDAGSVTLGAGRVDGGVSFWVQDTGDGIPLALQEVVFEKFRQVGDTLTSKPQGTGLGLPICRQIVEAHQGRITVESAPGVGSTFRVVLPDVGFVPSTPLESRTPTPTPPPRQAAPAAPVSADGQRAPQVLVVDDDPSLRELLRQQLSERGYDVRLASSGNDAIAQVRKERPDVVVLDVKMPDLSGYDVAAMLRNDPATETLPIMVLSILQDRERGLRVGVDHHMVKPADPDELAAVVGQLAGERASHRRVLVVDDRSSAASDFARLLETKGYHVESTDPDECLEAAKSARPDLIVLDAAPGAHEELVRAIRFERDLQHVLVVQLTDRGPDATD